MESILNQLFWIWAPLSFLPEWLRIFVVLFVLLQIARPILIYVVPPCFGLVGRLLKKGLYLLAYPVMALIGSRLRGLREAGHVGVPAWVDGIENMFAFFERFFNKVIQLTSKRKRNRAGLKRWSFYAATAFAILVTAAIVNNPNEWYAVKWKNADRWLTQDKLGGQLGFQRGTAPESVRVTAAPNKELVLNKQYKDGGNIRESPNLAARRLYTMAVGEVVRFMNEERVDERGLKWLKVETANGQVTGWISARIVKER